MSTRRQVASALCQQVHVVEFLPFLSEGENVLF